MFRELVAEITPAPEPVAEPPSSPVAKANTQESSPPSTPPDANPATVAEPRTAGQAAVSAASNLAMGLTEMQDGLSLIHI